MPSETAASAPRLGRGFNDGTLALVALGVILCSLVVWTAQSPNVERTDFALTYVGAHIVHSGEGSRLYDTALQVRLRDSLFQHASPLYFEHPPFEALALAPLAALPFRTAYLIWGLTNAALLMVLIIWLRPYLSWPAEDISYVLLWLLFAPLLVALYQGQSSILVTAAFAIGLIQIKRGHPVVAGVALALGLVKFQFILPFAFIVLIRKQWRILSGLAGAGAFLGAWSLIGIGREGLAGYFRLLSDVGQNPQDLSYGSAVDMPTLHGLIYAIGGRHLPPIALTVVAAAASLILLIWIAVKWKGANGEPFNLVFASAVAGSLVSGSHMFTHDFSPLVLALFLACASAQLKNRWILRVTAIAFWAFPVYFLFVKWHCLYVMAVCLLVFACWCRWAAGQRLKTAESTAVA